LALNFSLDRSKVAAVSIALQFLSGALLVFLRWPVDLRASGPARAVRSFGLPFPNLSPALA
jgi:hypothetical protein